MFRSKKTNHIILRTSPLHGLVFARGSVFWFGCLVRIYWVSCQKVTNRIYYLTWQVPDGCFGFCELGSCFFAVGFSTKKTNPYHSEDKSQMDLVSCTRGYEVFWFGFLVRFFPAKKTIPYQFWGQVPDGLVFAIKVSVFWVRFFNKENQPYRSEDKSQIGLVFGRGLLHFGSVFYNKENQSYHSEDKSQMDWFYCVY